MASQMPGWGDKGGSGRKGGPRGATLTSIIRRARWLGGHRWIMASLAALVCAVCAAIVSILVLRTSPSRVVSFEDVELDGVGNLRTLKGLSKRGFSELLPIERYCLYAGDLAAPPGWPSSTQVRRYRRSTYENGRECLLEIWLMRTSEGSWDFFDSTDATDFREAGKELIYVYERKGVTCTPVVSLTFSADDKCVQALMTVCRQVLALRARDRAEGVDYSGLLNPPIED